MDVVRTAVSFLGAEDPDLSKSNPEINLKRAVAMMAKIPTIIAAFHRHRKGLDFIPPRGDIGYVANFFNMIFGKVPARGDFLARRMQPEGKRRARGGPVRGGAKRDRRHLRGSNTSVSPAAHSSSTSSPWLNGCGPAAVGFSTCRVLGPTSTSYWNRSPT